MPNKRPKQKRIVKCPKCKNEKPATSFPTDNSRKYGLYPWCRECVSYAWRERYRNSLVARKKHLAKIWFSGNKDRIRAYNKRKLLKWGTKIAAQTKLRNAVKSGRVVKLPCEAAFGTCGILKVQGHHPDYKKPLEVVWLCDRHHKERHNRLILLPPQSKGLANKKIK